MEYVASVLLVVIVAETAVSVVMAKVLAVSVVMANAVAPILLEASAYLAMGREPSSAFSLEPRLQASWFPRPFPRQMSCDGKCQVGG